MKKSKALWLTDLKLPELTQIERSKLYADIKKRVAKKGITSLILSGNTSDAARIIPDLFELKAFSGDTSLEIFFVAGNIEFWGSDLKSVDKKLTKNFGELGKGIHYLTSQTIPLMIEEGVYIVGTNGYPDLSEGVVRPLNLDLGEDDFHIADFKYSKNLGGEGELKRKVFEYATTSTFALSNQIDEALQLNADKIIVATHTPPFKECVPHLREYQFPFTVHRSLGDMLTVKAKANPDVEFLVLSGSAGKLYKYLHLENLLVITNELASIMKLEL